MPGRVEMGGREGGAGRDSAAAGVGVATAAEAEAGPDASHRFFLGGCPSCSCS